MHRTLDEALLREEMARQGNGRRVLLPHEAAQAIAPEGYTRREFLANAVNLGKLALVAGAGTALQACGGGAGLDGRISTSNPSTDQRLVALLKEYVSHWVNYDKPKLDAAFTKLQREYGINNADTRQMNVDLMDRHNLFLTDLGIKNITLHDIHAIKEVPVYAFGKYMGIQKVVLLGNKIFSTYLKAGEKSGLGGHYPLGPLKQEVIFSPYTMTRDIYGEGRILEILTKHDVYHEYGHVKFGWSGHDSGEKGAELFALSTKVNEHITNNNEIMVYYKKHRNNSTHDSQIILNELARIKKNKGNTNLGKAINEMLSEMTELYSQLRRMDSSLPWRLEDAPDQIIAPMAYKLYFDHITKLYGGTYTFTEMTKHLPIPKPAK